MLGLLSLSIKFLASGQHRAQVGQWPCLPWCPCLGSEIVDSVGFVCTKPVTPALSFIRILLGGHLLYLRIKAPIKQTTSTVSAVQKVQKRPTSSLFFYLCSFPWCNLTCYLISFSPEEKGPAWGCAASKGCQNSFVIDPQSIKMTMVRIGLQLGRTPGVSRLLPANILSTDLGQGFKIICY